MRAAAMAELGKSDDSDDDDASDDGLHNPVDYALRTWQEHRLHDSYPEPGGLNDQDPSLVMEDWGFLNARFNWWFATLSDMDDGGGDLFAEPDGDLPDWGDL
jgi:hypothetical protein